MAVNKGMLVLLALVVLGGCGEAPSVQPRGEDGDGWVNATYEVVEGTAGRFDVGVQMPADGGGTVSVTFKQQNFDIERVPDVEPSREK